MRKYKKILADLCFSNQSSITYSYHNKTKNLCECTLYIYRVDSDLVIKVGDFGLSRDIYTGNYYRMTKTNKCPVKWMPPETIRDGISTEKSDVVSLGSFFHLYIM